MSEQYTPTDEEIQEQFEAGAMVTGFSYSRNEATIDWQLWLQERDKRIAAAAEQRGAERALREAAEHLGNHGPITMSHREVYDYLNNRADQEGDDETH